MLRIRPALTAAAAVAVATGVTLGVADTAEATTWKTYHSRTGADTLSVCQARLSNQVRLRSLDGARIGTIEQCHSTTGGTYTGAFYYYVPLKSSR